jgi:hypothetical protein
MPTSPPMRCPGGTAIPGGVPDVQRRFGALMSQPAVLVLAISLYGQLFNELRDPRELRRCNAHRQRSRPTAHWLMMFWLVVGGMAAAVSILSRLVPPWVFLLTLALAALLLAAPSPGRPRDRPLTSGPFRNTKSQQRSPCSPGSRALGAFPRLCWAHSLDGSGFADCLESSLRFSQLRPRRCSLFSKAQ